MADTRAAGWRSFVSAAGHRYDTNAALAQLSAPTVRRTSMDEPAGEDAARARRGSRRGEIPIVALTAGWILGAHFLFVLTVFAGFADPTPVVGRRPDGTLVPVDARSALERWSAVLTFEQWLTALGVFLPGVPLLVAIIAFVSSRKAVAVFFGILGLLILASIFWFASLGASPEM
ncbi:hypothetical protein ACIBG7_27270 [Nonomuraea sp. NPDC050328]|uniref:hypothetical protein n=1 Tax=Nonomuraea sp. NPDC050328 TaxID=3364361 RepID=UPI0037BD493A